MNYRIEAMNVLLKEDCILQRYYPLLPYKELLMKGLRNMHCVSKADCMQLPDEALMKIGLPDNEMVNLFRCFLVMYDAKEAKFREIETIAEDGAQAETFRQLYLLPGVKAVRARLYDDAGYKSLSRIAAASPEQIIRDTSNVILQKGLAMKAPLPKEVRTHIAVAKALTIYAV